MGVERPKNARQVPIVTNNVTSRNCHVDSVKNTVSCLSLSGLQLAKVNEFLQVEDVTLKQISGGVLNDTNTLYNQIRSMNFYKWKMGL